MKFKFNDSFIGCVNLLHRKDRLTHITTELERVGIKAELVTGINTKSNIWNRPPFEKMFNRGRGSIGCMLSQMLVMSKAFVAGKNAIVLEDDVVFCSDMQTRIPIIEDFLNSVDEWDVFWLGGTYHKEPTWHSTKHNPDIVICNCDLNRDWEKTDNEYIVRTYGAFSTHAYIVNVNSIEKILNLLNDNMHLAMGIDHLFIEFQPNLKTFAFSYGCAKQIDNQSDIGTGITRFSGFAKLGEHWFKDKL